MNSGYSAQRDFKSLNINDLRQFPRHWSPKPFHTPPISCWWYDENSALEKMYKTSQTGLILQASTRSQLSHRVPNNDPSFIQTKQKPAYKNDPLIVHRFLFLSSTSTMNKPILGKYMKEVMLGFMLRKPNIS